MRAFLEAAHINYTAGLEIASFFIDDVYGIPYIYYRIYELEDRFCYVIL